MNILLVCTGNTCRSAMAEGILKSLAEGQDDIYISSAGISTMDGLRPSANAIHAADELESDISMHQSRQLNAAMVESADVVLCMTTLHKDTLDKIYPQQKEKIRMLGEEDIEDPFGEDIEVYRKCASDLMYLLENYLEEIE